MATDESNGRVTVREVDAKLESLRQENKSEHYKTRFYMLLGVIGSSGAGKALAALGFLHFS